MSRILIEIAFLGAPRDATACTGFRALFWCITLARESLQNEATGDPSIHEETAPWCLSTSAGRQCMTLTLRIVTARSRSIPEGETDESAAFMTRKIRLKRFSELATL